MLTPSYSSSTRGRYHDVSHSPLKTWELRGYDAFAQEWYPLPGCFLSEEEALRAARHWLSELERMQPSAHSGGQQGIQDRVYVVRPDGSLYVTTFTTIWRVRRN